MNIRVILIGLLIMTGGMTTMVQAGADAFHPGPVFSEYGNIADVDVTMPIPEGTHFEVSFDVTDGGEDGELNRNFGSVARFINMHVAAGVPLENIELAVVIHGSATHDVTLDEHYEPLKGAHNANAELIAALTGAGVRVIVCGQSAAYNDVTNADLLPNVEMALSAMTAHALLAQEGYTVNPF